MSRIALASVILGLAFGSACSRPAADPPKRYPVTGQVLAVAPDKLELTLKHDDIPGYMPAMTMIYPVASAAEMEGRTPGELIAATLEVTLSQGKLTEIKHAGEAPLPANSNEAALAAGVLSPGDEVPDAAFIDQADRRRSFAEWKGSLTLVTFVYTSCPLPTFCPLMDQNFATIQRAVAEDSLLRGRVRLVSISIDPAHDTPAVLAAHAKKRSADENVWTFLTGDVPTLQRFAGRFGVGIIRPEGASDITHNLRTTLIDPAGRVLKIYPGGDWTPGTVLADLRAAAKAP